MQYQRTRSLFLAAGLGVLLFLLAGNIHGLLGGAGKWQRVIDQSFSLVRDNYVRELEAEEIAFRTLRGLFDNLDDFSRFMSPAEYGDFQQNMRGDYGGVGIYIERSERGIQVITPILGGAAFEAGLKPGDRIVRIDGEDATGMSLEAARNRLRGAPGTRVLLEISRAGRDETFEVSLLRSTVHVPSVLSARFLGGAHGGIGYVLLADFQEDAGDKVAEAVERLKRQRLNALILDMRGNGGGAYKSALKVADLFLERGVLVRVRYRGGAEVAEEATGECVGDFPLVVLVDGGSASASEIVAAALRDNRRARLVGEPTYGKGSVQQIFEITLPPAPQPSNRNSQTSQTSRKAAARMTVAYFYSPAGEPIDRSLRESRRGIQPDVLVEPTEEQLTLIRNALRTEWVVSNTGAANGLFIEDVDPQVIKALEVLSTGFRP